MTDEPTEKQRVDKLVRLARSWQYAPGLILKSDGYRYDGYEIKEKAYILTNTSEQKDLHLSIKANSERPLLNPAFVIKGWGNKAAEVAFNGQKLTAEKDYSI